MKLRPIATARAMIDHLRIVGSQPSLPAPLTRLETIRAIATPPRMITAPKITRLPSSSTWASIAAMIGDWSSSAALIAKKIRIAIITAVPTVREGAPLSAEMPIALTDRSKPIDGSNCSIPCLASLPSR